MQLRTSARLFASVAALLLATALTSCGFDYATDRVYTPADGVNDRDARVDVLNAVVVSGQEGSGTFIASFANNEQEDPATVESLKGAGDDTSVSAEEFDPIEIAPGALVNLADEGGIVVTGDLAAGDFVSIEIAFGNGETVEMDVPAVTNCGAYEGLDISAESSDGASTEESDQCAVETPEPVEH